MTEFFARHFEWIALVNARSLRADLQAGVVNAVIVLPQGVAYALIAGLPPEFGLYAAIVPAIVAALLGSSHHLISGPTAALSIVVLSVVGQHADPGTPAYIEAALVLTLVVGLFQLALTLGKLGGLVNFVSHTVVLGFTSGVAILIMFRQFRHVLGVDISQDLTFAQNILAVVGSAGDANPRAIATALATLATCLLLQRFFPRSPHMLAGLVAGGLTALALGGVQADIEMVGEIPRGLPPLSVPRADSDALLAMLPGAVAVGLLGLVEAVSIARAISLRSGQLIRGNREFFGQGAANVVGAFFSCYVSSGSFTRSGVNYDSGAKTPLSGVFAGIALAAIVAAFAPLARHLPLAAMGAILLLVGWRLLLWGHIRTIVTSSRGEALVLGATFLAVLALPLETAIYIGIGVSLALYLRRTSRPRMVRIDAKGAERPDIAVLQLEGSLFFGAAPAVAERIRSCKERHLVLVAEGVNFIDVAGAEMLAAESKLRAESGGKLVICKLREPAGEMLAKGAFAGVFAERIANDLTEALAIIDQDSPEENATREDKVA